MDGTYFMKSIGLKRTVLALALALAATAIVATALLREQQALSEKLIRLHVVANSDSEADQAVKLQVRDAVLAVTQPLTAGEDPYGALAGALPEIQQAAEDCLATLGVTDPVAVSLGPEEFPTRVYESFALPAGQYTALRIEIGEGAGQNWWCVVFPPLCLGSVTETVEETAADAGLTEGQVSLITGEDEGYVVKFRAIELLEEFKGWLAGS